MPTYSFLSGDVPDITIRLIAAVVILVVTAINVFGVKVATQIQVTWQRVLRKLFFILLLETHDLYFHSFKTFSSDFFHCVQIVGTYNRGRYWNLLPSVG